MFESLKEKFFGGEAERKFIAAIKAGKIVIVDSELVTDTDYDGDEYYLNRSYIMFVSAADKDNAKYNKFAKLAPNGEMKLVANGTAEYSGPGEYYKVWRYAVSYIRKANAEKEAAAKKANAALFLLKMSEVFGEL